MRGPKLRSSKCTTKVPEPPRQEHYYACSGNPLWISKQFWVDVCHHRSTAPRLTFTEGQVLCSPAFLAKLCKVVEFCFLPGTLVVESERSKRNRQSKDGLLGR